jgi:hypothetical protein
MKTRVRDTSEAFMGDTEVPAKKRLNVVKNCLLLIEKVRDLMKFSIVYYESIESWSSDELL